MQTVKPSVEEMNDAIHKFMGGEWTIIRNTEGGHIERVLFESTDYDKVVFLCNDQVRITGKQYKVVPYLPRYEYKYHSSWDVLMPVVQKILNTDMKTFDSYALWVSDSLGTADIKQVHQAVYNYIESHSQTPTPLTGG